MAAGLTDAGAYLEEWRQESRPCGDDLEREVQTEAERLEAQFGQIVLAGLVRTGGLRGA